MISLWFSTSLLLGEAKYFSSSIMRSIIDRSPWSWFWLLKDINETIWQRIDLKFDCESVGRRAYAASIRHFHTGLEAALKSGG